MDLSACSAWHSTADSASAAATPPVAKAAVSSTTLSNAAIPSTGTAAVSANAATASSGVRAADPSPGAVLQLTEAANATSTLCADSGALQQAPANTAALSPGFSAANFLTGTTFVSAGAEADPSVAGAVLTDATLAPTSAASAPTGANLASNVARTAPVTIAVASSKSTNVGGYTAGTLGTIMHDCVLTGQRE